MTQYIVSLTSNGTHSITPCVIEGGRVKLLDAVYALHDEFDEDFEAERKLIEALNKSIENGDGVVSCDLDFVSAGVV